MTKIITLHLEDHGQDFLWFKLKGAEIVDCGPFQASHWVGRHIAKAGQPEAAQIAWAKGDVILFPDSGRTLNYPVAKVEGQDDDQDGGEVSLPILSPGEMTLLELLSSTDETPIHNRRDQIVAGNLEAKGLANVAHCRVRGSTLRGYASITAEGRQVINDLATTASAAACSDGLRPAVKYGPVVE